MTLGTAQIIQGNALALPLADGSVDLVCTSPPYFGLRSYQDGGEHYLGQLGSEPTPAEFLDALIAATAEMVRVLKPSGSIFVNLGDKYAMTGVSGPSNMAQLGQKLGTGGGHSHDRAIRKRTPIDPGNIRPKSLMGLPWRYAIACIDQLGLILRAEIIWAKPNGLPESVTDRVRRSHEQWFHFTKQPRYFAAVDEIREAHSPISQRIAESGRQGRITAKQSPDRNDTDRTTRELHALGKLPGSVWQIATQPLEVPAELGVDHFAAYPMEWPRRIIQGWTPQGICTACGEGRRPIVDREQIVRAPNGLAELGKQSHRADALRHTRGDIISLRNILGYTCSCDYRVGAALPLPPTRPAVVLDPFMGTGTTLVVAKALGRNSIGVDLSADYCRLAQWRINNPGQIAAALQVEKPDVIPAGQLSLFEDGMP